MHYFLLTVLPAGHHRTKLLRCILAGKPTNTVWLINVLLVFGMSLSTLTDNPFVVLAGKSCYAKQVALIIFLAHIG